MNRLLTVAKPSDIPVPYRNTPIGLLLAYHNLNQPYRQYKNAQLLIGMCMDHRKHLHIPDNFAYIIRAGGANLRYSEFKVSYAIAIGDVKHLALIGHNHCGMAYLQKQKESFIQGLVSNAGWSSEMAEEHFTRFAPFFETGNEIDFILNEAQRLRLQYPKIIIAPMMYLVEDNHLYFIEEQSPQ